MTRRDLLKIGGFAVLSRLEIPLCLLEPPRRALRMAVITDVHHGLAPDALQRLSAFVDEVRHHKDIDLILQLGDFCHAEPAADPFVQKFRELKQPKIQVLGNHDMDKVDKEQAMKYWGMKSRYGKLDKGDFTFLWLDLNHFKKGGRLFDYEKGNYFTDNATHNWADPEQLKWLEETLMKTRKPVVLLSHQPLGFSEPNQTMPPEQIEVLEVIWRAKTKNPKGAVALSMFGHLHVDRLEHVEGIPFYCVNSASYFWSSGMWPYEKPLFAMMELTTDGKLVVQGIESRFTKKPPAVSDTVIGRSASISNRGVPLNL